MDLDFTKEYESFKEELTNIKDNILDKDSKIEEKKAYPILNFSVEIDETIYKRLKSVINIEKSDKSKKDFCIYYMNKFMKTIRDTINSSDNNELKEVVNNYMSIYLKDNNTIGIIVYDAIKNNEDDYAKVKFEITKEGYPCPYLCID